MLNSAIVVCEQKWLQPVVLAVCPDTCLDSCGASQYRLDSIIYPAIRRIDSHRHVRSCEGRRAISTNNKKLRQSRGWKIKSSIASISKEDKFIHIIYCTCTDQRCFIDAFCKVNPLILTFSLRLWAGGPRCLALLLRFFASALTPE